FAATGSWTACSRRIIDAELRRLETVPGLGPAPRRSALRENRRLVSAERVITTPRQLIDSLPRLTFELIERSGGLIKCSMRKTQLLSCFIAVGLLSANQFARAADPAHPDQPTISPAEAISRLKEGNGRFTAGNPQHTHESIDER